MSNKMEQLLKVVINIPDIKHIAPKWVERNAQRLAFRVILTSGYITCARHYYPKWTSYFMDEEFRTHGAALLLGCYLKNGAYPEPAELANIWADQMMWLSEEVRQRHLAELVPVASRFLHCLEAELRVRPEFQPIFVADQPRNVHTHRPAAAVGRETTGVWPNPPNGCSRDELTHPS